MLFFLLRTSPGAPCDNCGQRVQANGIIEGMPRGRSHLGSATESAALSDVCVRLRLLDDAGHKTAKTMLVRVVSMLVKFCSSCVLMSAIDRAVDAVPLIVVVLTECFEQA